jgi:hypothetical protein
MYLPSENDLVEEIKEVMNLAEADGEREQE